MGRDEKVGLLQGIQCARSFSKSSKEVWRVQWTWHSSNTLLTIIHGHAFRYNLTPLFHRESSPYSPQGRAGYLTQNVNVYSECQISLHQHKTCLFIAMNSIYISRNDFVQFYFPFKFEASPPPISLFYRYRYKFYLKSEYKNIQHKLCRAFKTDIHVNNKTSIRTDMHKKQSTYIL